MAIKNSRSPFSVGEKADMSNFKKKLPKPHQP